MKIIKYKKDKLYIKNPKIFFYAFNTIMKLFFAVVYIRIITLTMIFADQYLVEYPLLTWYNINRLLSHWLPIIKSKQVISINNWDIF